MCAATLVNRVAIPLESIGAKRAEDGIRGSGGGAGCVDVFDADEPFAASRPRGEITSDGGH